VKPSLKNYNKHRPKILMVIGETLLYASTSVASYGILSEEKVVALGALFCGIGGHFFTKLYAASDK